MSIDTQPTPAREANGGFLGPLWCAVAILIASNLVGLAAYHYSLRRNDYWRTVNSTLTIDLAIEGDPRETLMTQAAFDNHCELGHFDCNQNVEGSSAVQALRRKPLPKVAEDLLQHNSYSSAYHLLKDLSLHNADSEVLQLVTDPLFDAPTLATFASNWYFQPAAEYVTHGREQDGLQLFKSFIDVMRNPAKRGEWLSLEGIDATDVPAIADIFCQVEDRLHSDECLLGFLKSLARSKDPDVLLGISHVADTYSKLPTTIKSLALEGYLRVWGWDGTGEPPSQLDWLTPSQSAAWQYAKGVRLQATAKTSAQCDDLLQQALSNFEKAFSGMSTDDYLYLPAKHHISDIETHRLDICNSSESKKQ